MRKLKPKRVSLLLIQLIVLISAVLYVAHVYYSNILPDKESKATFKTTTCFIVSKKLSTKGRFFHFYRADFLVSYDANKVQYHRWVSGNGLDTSYFLDEGEQEDILAQFDVGSTYPCYYHPNDPMLVVLVHRHNWFSLLHLIVPLAIFIIVFYYFWKNLFYVKKNSHRSRS